MATKRRYSDDDRANALAALAANGGNQKRTANQLGIPQQTLSEWVNGNVHPEATEHSERKKLPLAEAFDALARKCMDGITDADIKGATLWEKVKAAATCVDKRQLLLGKATQITQHGLGEISDADLDRELADLERAEAALAQGASETPGTEAA